MTEYTVQYTKLQKQQTNQWSFKRIKKLTINIVAFIAVVMVRSLNQFFIYSTVASLPPFTFLALRALVACVALFPLILVAYFINETQRAQIYVLLSSRTVFFELCRKVFVIGFLEGTLAYIAYAYADYYLSPEVATVLVCVGPFFSIGVRKIANLLFPFLKKEILNFRTYLGICTGFIGAIAVISKAWVDNLVTNTPATPTPYWTYIVFVLGVLSVAISSVFWDANKTIFNKNTNQYTEINLLVSTFGRNFVGLVIATIFAVTLDNFAPIVGSPHFESLGETIKSAYGDILWMGIGSGVFGVLSFYYLIQAIGPEKALAANFLVPVVGDSIAIVKLQLWNKYTAIDFALQIGGTLLVIYGMVLLAFDKLRKLVAKKKPRVEVEEDLPDQSEQT